MPEQTRDLSIGEALDLGCQMAMAGQHENACGLFRGVLMHEPENFEAIERLGSSLFELKRHHEALYWFWRGRKLNRKHPMALTNYGLTVGQLGHWEEAIPDLERAVYQAERSPTLSVEAKALVYNNLGNTLEKLKRYPQALDALERGIALNPNDAFPHYNRGIVLLRLNRQHEAIASLERAIAINPNDADAHYNRGMGRLLLGDLLNGFADYEARLLTSENEVMNLGLPADRKWIGDMIEGQRILVHCEQGLGDDIQFFRFLPLLARGNPAEILIIAHKPTAPLLEGLPVTVLPPRTNLEGRYDKWVALMSLPHYLGITSEAALPAPYVIPNDPERTAKWADSDEVRWQSRPNVGVVWAGNWRHKNNAHRSIPLEQFAAIFDAPCNFISLQQMQPIDTEAFSKLKAKHANLSALYLDDLRDTAAVIRNLDLVICVDTAVAHLAASLGVPTWILIPKFSTDWRWMLERTDSPWYPSACLFRQEVIGDWRTTLAKVKDALQRTAADRRAHQRVA